MNKQRGLSIIELMIGLAIGTIVLGSAGTLFVSTLRANLDAVKQQRFEQSVQVLMNTMAAGLRRAGFSNATTNLPDVSGWTSGSHYYTNGTCALFSYVDTTLSVAKQQFFGYKLDTITGIMYAYQADAIVLCSDTTTWQAMTDPTQITISQAPSSALFSSPLNPKLVEIHLIASATGLAVGANPVSREVITEAFIRNN